jgi:uncharacterized iron-regulated protein
MSQAARCILILAISLVLTVDAYAATIVTRVSDKQSVTLPYLISQAKRSDLVLVGEAHDDKAHHEMQLTLIRALCTPQSPFVIGLEMFQADSQPELDNWTAGKLSETDFQKIYARNWSLDWALYRDIFLYARDNQIPMVALNISKELVAKVSRSGFASLTPEESRYLPEGATCDLNNPHTAFLKSSFQEVFKHASNGRNFTFFCEAQTLRNSGMAMNIARYVKKHPGRKIVALAGIWHAVKNAIPDQLERSESALTNTVILPEIAELNAKNATPEVADYLIGR